MRIALFPRELDRDPAGFYQDDGGDVVHDIMRDDPAMLDVYCDWLRRRHPVHRLRPKQRLWRNRQQQDVAAELSMPG